MDSYKEDLSPRAVWTMLAAAVVGVLLLAVVKALGG